MSHMLKSVRVRMTLAAMTVTAVAVGLAGWMLVRSVEGSRLGDVREQAQAEVDRVARLLADGADPEEAVMSSHLSEGAIEVRAADGTMIAQNPVLQLLGEGNVMIARSLDERSAAVPAGGGSDRDEDAGPTPVDGSTDGGGEDGDAGAAREDAWEEAVAERAAGERILLPTPESLCLMDPTLCAPECVIEVQTCGAPACIPEEVYSQRITCPSAPMPMLGRTQISAGNFLFESQPMERFEKTVDTSQGELTVAAAAPVSEVVETVNEVRRSLWVLLPGLVGIVALFGWWLTGRALRPVEAIRLEAEAIGSATIHHRLPVPDTGDEIGRLARTMNAMLERLDHSARRQRQFVSDASHELRSPLAAIRTDVEVALREGDAADWPEVATAVLLEEGRLETLLADLLVLAADDEGKNGLRKSRVDLAELVGDVVEDTELADDSATHDVDVTGNANQLRRAVGNLVTNARRHASSRIEVGLRQAEGRVQVTVDDDGPGIPAADRERVFERFTRLDDGRTRDQGGSGLGLAVVRSIVVRHGGRVWADAGPMGGARFTIDLPTSSSQP